MPRLEQCERRGRLQAAWQRLLRCLFLLFLENGTCQISLTLSVLQFGHRSCLFLADNFGYSYTFFFKTCEQPFNSSRYMMNVENLGAWITHTGMILAPVTFPWNRVKILFRQHVFNARSCQWKRRVNLLQRFPLITISTLPHFAIEPT